MLISFRGNILDHVCLWGGGLQSQVRFSPRYARYADMPIKTIAGTEIHDTSNPYTSPLFSFPMP